MKPILMMVFTGSPKNSHGWPALTFLYKEV